MTTPCDTRQSTGTAKSPVQKRWRGAKSVLKVLFVLAIIAVCVKVLYGKVAHFTWDEFTDGLATVPPHQIALALLFTAINFVVLTGYDWIAVAYLRKRVPLRRIMTGAVIGYALSNLLGWMLGGTSVRYRLYTHWGFTWVEVLAFISILSATFWLGLFLLAGITFVFLPTEFPAQYASQLYFSPQTYGIGFLCCVGAYLSATLAFRRPIRVRQYFFSFPPFRLSLLQLVVSAIDFALASLVLFVLMPPGTVSYSTVLMSYLSAMIVTVILHVPGGFGVLEVIVLEMLVRDDNLDPGLPLAVTCGLLLYRVIYYLAPGITAATMYLREEYRWYTKRQRRLRFQSLAPSTGVNVKH